MSKKFINWDPEKDIYTKKGEIETHIAVHSKKNVSGSNQPRLQYLKEAEKLIGKKITGMVLDIGCGNGYSSVEIAKTRNIKQVHALECTLPAVDKLIRKNFENNNIAPEKYELILGSFNDIKYKQYYDCIISLGAIHHSGNLIRTMKSLYQSLKPNGFIIAQEPYMDSSTPNSVYIQKEKVIKKVQGVVEVKEFERDDHFFRECEYLTAFYHSGFDVIFKKVKSGNPKIYNALIILSKPDDNPQKIPHAWF